MSERQMSGAEMVLAALADNGVETVFGYPGGAVLPIYDAMFQQNQIRHVLVRQEGGAVHAAEGYARSTGRVGCVLVTSGPGATNAVTGLLDAQMDSIPLVCITGQVPTHLIGNDAFQEADTTGITRPCTKHNYLVKDVEKLAQTLHEAFHVARSGRPGPVLVDLPKDVQFAIGTYRTPDEFEFSYRPAFEPDIAAIEQAVALIAKAERPLFYTGGGVINSGPEAAKTLTELVRLTGIPCTSTLMGLGAFPASDPQFLGMLGMHGTYEANLATHGCDLLICVGARFDDRVTGKVSAFSPGSQKIHIDIDASSINKNVRVDLPVVGDAGRALALMLGLWKQQGHPSRAEVLKPWWKQIDAWRAVDCLSYEMSDPVIKPQYALERLREALKGRDNVYITTEVGQHQMWAAQFLPFDQPNRWMTSGGLGTMGYGLPAAVGVQMAHPDAVVIDVAGEASILMNIQEMSTAVQYRLPVKIFIMNNKWMGMVRQWQELLHGGRFSESYTAALPDFVKLAEAFGGTGLRATTVDELDKAIADMLDTPGPVILDVAVDETEMCFPMIPGGAAHNEIMLRRQDQTESDPAAREEGMVLV
jgi:acetolactate synthase I/II/III large subunit